MLQLQGLEFVLFSLAMLMYLYSAGLGVRQLRNSGEKWGVLLPIPMPLLIGFGVLLQCGVMAVRAREIGAVPLTSLFDSLMVLTIVFGGTFLVLSVFVRQVWFSSVMCWIMLLMMVLAGVVAEPAVKLQGEAAGPWVGVHAVLMVLFGVSIAFAGGVAFLFLVCRWNLKRKQLLKVIGKIPNVEVLGRANGIMLVVCFVLMTLGVASGIGLALFKSESLKMTASDWVFDAKMILMVVTWAAFGGILLLKRIVVLSSKSIAIVTVLLFLLVLLGLIGVSGYSDTAHDFTDYSVETISTE